jgi:ABC-type multidrug transport system ATPase subunit
MGLALRLRSWVQGEVDGRDGSRSGILEYGGPRMLLEGCGWCRSGRPLSLRGARGLVRVESRVILSQNMDPFRQVVVDAVTRSFGTTVALRGINAVFSAGEVTTLEGHNGSGKSTLLAIIGTLIAATSGRVVYGATSVVSADIRRQIGWVSHDTHCYPDLSTKQNVELAATLYGADPVTGWERSVRRFGLSTFAGAPIRQLSRGQRQRAALARALVHNPSLLLLDEPTTGLDAEGLERLLVAVAEEASRGCIVVLVTHDSAVASRVASRRLWLHQGRLRAGGAG